MALLHCCSAMLRLHCFGVKLGGSRRIPMAQPIADMASHCRHTLGMASSQKPERKVPAIVGAWVNCIKNKWRPRRSRQLLTSEMLLTSHWLLDAPYLQPGSATLQDRPACLCSTYVSGMRWTRDFFSSARNSHMTHKHGMQPVLISGSNEAPNGQENVQPATLGM